MKLSREDLRFARMAGIETRDLAGGEDRPEPDPQWQADDWRAYAEQLEDDRGRVDPVLIIFATAVGMILGYYISR